MSVVKRASEAAEYKLEKTQSNHIINVTNIDEFIAYYNILVACPVSDSSKMNPFNEHLGIMSTHGVMGGYESSWLGSMENSHFISSESFETEGFDLVEFCGVSGLKLNFVYENVVHIGDKTLLFRIRKNEDASVYSVSVIANLRDPDVVKPVLEKTKPYLLKKKPESSVLMLVSKYGGFETKKLELKPFSYQEDDYPIVCHKPIKKLIADLSSTTITNKGRLNILLGEPGTGKTSLIKAISNLKNMTVLNVPSKMAPDLSNPSFLPALMTLAKDKPLFTIVIEDGDNLLLKRNAQNNDLASILLNFTSGMIGDSLNVKVVVTANLQRNELDPAFLRFGRLGNIIDVPAFSEEEAKAWATRNAYAEPDSIVGSHTLADLYSLLDPSDDEDETSKTIAKTTSRIGF